MLEGDFFPVYFVFKGRTLFFVLKSLECSFFLDSEEFFGVSVVLF